MKINGNLLFTAAQNVKNLRLHKYMWSCMAITHDTLDKFKKLVYETDSKGFNVFQLAVMHNKMEIIQWMWQKLQRDVFYDEEFRSFLKIETKDGKNILQLAAACNKKTQTHEWLWNKMVQIFGKEGLKEMIEHGDRNDRNVFHLSAISNSNEVFTKLYALAKTHLGATEMRRSLRKKELVYDANVFDIAKEHAMDCTLYPWLKTKRHKYF